MYAMDAVGHASDGADVRNDQPSVSATVDEVVPRKRKKTQAKKVTRQQKRSQRKVRFLCCYSVIDTETLLWGSPACT